MTLSATVYAAEGSERYDDVDAALGAPGETWVHAPDAERVQCHRAVLRLGPARSVA